MSEYSNDELAAIYELGRLYFEMGYFAPAERIFGGLSSVDDARTPARIGLGLVKLERGLYQEAATHFRLALQSGSFELQAKLGLCASFIAAGELGRAQSILGEISKSLENGQDLEAEEKRLFEALILRTRKKST